MKDVQTQLKGILAEVVELAGAVAFGQSRLQEFQQMLDFLATESAAIRTYRHYQLQTQKHREITSTLNTTIQSLTDWSALALAHRYELEELVINSADPLYRVWQDAHERTLQLISDLQQQIQQLQKMQQRAFTIMSGLVQKKRAVAAFMA